MDYVPYGGWPHCVRLANGKLELIVTTDIGPRLVHLSVPGKENLFSLLPEHAGLTGGAEFRLYGGHRVMHMPEIFPRSYEADNDPVPATLSGQTLTLRPAEERVNGIQKELAITLVGDEPHLVLTETLRNTGRWPIEIAPWGVSMLGEPGLAIVPQAPWREPGAQPPLRKFILWGTSDLRDPRVYWGSDYVLARPDPQYPNGWKGGVNTSRGWAAYWRAGQLLVKRFPWDPAANYPDAGCTIEIFFCGRYLELETVGPLTTLAPGASLTWTENWHLFDNVARVTTEEDADRIVKPLAEGL